MATLRNVGIVYVATAGALIAYNVRWSYLWGAIVGAKPKILPLAKKVAEAPPPPADRKTTKEKAVVSVVLLHGMWHDASFYHDLQEMLSKAGYTSYAISLLPSQRLLPGGSQKELVADLEVTLQNIITTEQEEQEQQKFVIVGHSQGGLLTQSALRNSEYIREHAMGAILLGTYPLGLTPPLNALLKEPRNMYTDLGYLWICLFGKLMNIRYTKHIFLMPTTDETKPKMKYYIDQLLKAPSDGLITMSHFPQAPPTPPLSHPTLILGAQNDCIYPPHLLTEAFKERFSNTKQIIAKDQAHCFVDPGWEKTMAEPLIGWLDELVESKQE